MLAEPNPDDGLMADISQEFKLNRPEFLRKAALWVQQYAKEVTVTKGTKRFIEPSEETLSKVSKT